MELKHVTWFQKYWYYKNQCFWPRISQVVEEMFWGFCNSIDVPSIEEEGSGHERCLGHKRGWGHWGSCSRQWFCFFKKGDQRVCYSFRDHNSQPPLEDLCQGRADSPGFQRNSTVFVPDKEHWTYSLFSLFCSKVHRTLQVFIKVKERNLTYSKLQTTDSAHSFFFLFC